MCRRMHCLDECAALTHYVDRSADFGLTDNSFDGYILANGDTTGELSYRLRRECS